MELTLDNGAQARLLSLDGEHIVVVAPEAFPPGSTLRATIAGEPQPYVVKVKNSRRQQDGDEAVFVVEGRLVNLSRRQRQRLEASSAAN